MILDRPYQLELLKKLSESYPSPFFDPDMDEKMDADEKHRYVANMRYLEEHGLVESGIYRSMDGLHSLTPATITSRAWIF